MDIVRNEVVDDLKEISEELADLSTAPLFKVLVVNKSGPCLRTILFLLWGVQYYAAPYYGPHLYSRRYPSQHFIGLCGLMSTNENTYVPCM